MDRLQLDWLVFGGTFNSSKVVKHALYEMAYSDRGLELAFGATSSAILMTAASSSLPSTATFGTANQLLVPTRGGVSQWLHAQKLRLTSIFDGACERLDELFAGNEQWLSENAEALTAAVTVKKRRGMRVKSAGNKKAKVVPEHAITSQPSHAKDIAEDVQQEETIEHRNDLRPADNLGRVRRTQNCVLSEKVLINETKRQRTRRPAKICKPPLRAQPTKPANVATISVPSLGSQALRPDPYQANAPAVASADNDATPVAKRRSARDKRTATGTQLKPNIEHSSADQAECASLADRRDESRVSVSSGTPSNRHGRKSIVEVVIMTPQRPARNDSNEGIVRPEMIQMSVRKPMAQLNPLPPTTVPEKHHITDIQTQPTQVSRTAAEASAEHKVEAWTSRFLKSQHQQAFLSESKQQLPAGLPDNGVASSFPDLKTTIAVASTKADEDRRRDSPTPPNSNPLVTSNSTLSATCNAQPASQKPVLPVASKAIAAIRNAGLVDASLGAQESPFTCARRIDIKNSRKEEELKKFLSGGSEKLKKALGILRGSDEVVEKKGSAGEHGKAIRESSNSGETVGAMEDSKVLPVVVKAEERPLGPSQAATSRTAVMETPQVLIQSTLLPTPSKQPAARPIASAEQLETGLLDQSGQEEDLPAKEADSLAQLLERQDATVDFDISQEGPEQLVETGEDEPLENAAWVRSSTAAPTAVATKGLKASSAVSEERLPLEPSHRSALLRINPPAGQPARALHPSKQPASDAEGESKRRLRERQEKAIARKKQMIEKAMHARSAQAKALMLPETKPTQIRPVTKTFLKPPHKKPLREAPALPSNLANSKAPVVSDELAKRAIVNHATLKTANATAVVEKQSQRPITPERYKLPFPKSKTPKATRTSGLSGIPTSSVVNSDSSAHASLVAASSPTFPDIPSDDDEDFHHQRARAMVSRPKWAATPNLSAAVAAQRTMRPEDIFGDVQPIKLEDFFKDSGKKFRARSSSANWNL